MTAFAPIATQPIAAPDAEQTAAPETPAVWYSASWPKRRKISVGQGQVTADVPAFPLMITAKDDAALLSARRDGRDIVFADAAGAKLPHELIDYFAGIEHQAGWVWFTRPSALRYVGTHDRTYVSYQKNDGAITVAQYDHTAESWATPFDVHAPGDTTNLYVQEDHGPAALLVRASDKRLMAFHAGHGGPDIFLRISTNPEDATAWGTPVNLAAQFGVTAYSYPCPVQFSDGTIWLIFRGRPSTTSIFYYAESTDGGATWSAAQEFFTTEGYGYCQFAQNGDTLHFHGNPEHPRWGTSNPLRAWKYVRGTGWRTPDNVALTLPFADANLTAASSAVTIYNGAGTGGRSWLWDITVGADGHPRALYARVGDTANHLVWHARWTGSAWVNTQIVNSGGHIGSYDADRVNYQDDWYSGGMCFDHSSPSNVYIAREVSGPPHEIWRYVTTDEGATWSGSAITEASKRRNFRPIVPRNAHADLQVVWRYGAQPDYTKHLTGITSHPLRPRVNQLAARVKVDLVAAADSELWMYWGNASAAAQESPASVWSAADKLVWHGRDAYNSAVTAVSDSSGNGYNGTKSAQNEPFEVEGRAFRAMQFDGSDGINFGNGLNMAGWSALTVLAGVKYAGAPTSAAHTVLNSWSADAAASGIILRINPTTSPAHKVQAYVATGTNVQTGGTADLAVTPNAWTLVGFTYDASAGLKIVRGVDSATVAAGAGALDADAGANLYAGVYSDAFAGTQPLTGAMEAVLISNEVKSAAYIEAWRKTWDAPTTFAVAAASAELLPPTITAVTATNITQTTATITVSRINPAAGTLYLVIVPAGVTPSWSRANIGTNSGWTATTIAYHDADTDPGSGATYVFTPDASGLSASTPYDAYAVWDDGTNTSSIVSTLGWSTTSAAQSLAASGAATASGNASLAAQIALAGIGVSLASGTAALSGSMPLAASGASTAAGTATPKIDIALSALGLTVSSGTAALSSSASGSLHASGAATAGGSAATVANVTISASGLAQAAAQAGVSASVLLAGAGAAAASGNAALAVQLQALAAGAAQASGSATISGSAAGELSAYGQAAASGAALLTLDVRIAAAGSAAADGSAALSSGSAAQIAAAGGATASGAGTVSAQVTLTGAGFVQAMGAGVLHVQIPLAAAGAAISVGTASLSELPDVLPRVASPYRTWRVRAHNRTLRIRA